MPDINKSFPSNYLKASDLDGKSAVVTIAGVKFEGVGREKEMKAVLHFVGKEKGMVLNKTNARKIQEITGSPLTEEWEGHAIVLYPTETEFGGETVECIRIKPVGKSVMGKMLPTPKRAAPAVEEHEDLDNSDIPF